MTGPARIGSSGKREADSCDTFTWLLLSGWMGLVTTGRQVRELSQHEQAVETKHSLTHSIKSGKSLPEKTHQKASLLRRPTLNAAQHMMQFMNLLMWVAGTVCTHTEEACPLGMT